MTRPPGRHWRHRPPAGRHRRTATPPTPGGVVRHRLPYRRPPVRRLVVALLLVGFGLGPWSVPGSGVGPATEPTSLDRAQPDAAALWERRDEAPPAASRSARRTVPMGEPPEPSPEPAPEPEPDPPPAESGAAEPDTDPTVAAAVTPVGGLSPRQMQHAQVIVQVGQRAQLPQRAYVVAMATALQESYLRNLANGAVPESFNYDYDAVAADHDSVGVFQQRPSAGWGTVAQLMDPSYAAGKFYEALRRVAGWPDMSVAQAAQAVQVSAFPDAYAKHEPLARLIVDTLT